MNDKRKTDTGTQVYSYARELVARVFNQDMDLPQVCACGAGCEVDPELGMPVCSYQEQGETLKFIEDVVEG